MWMLPLYLHVNQKSDYDIMIYVYVSKILDEWQTVEPDHMLYYLASNLDQQGFHSPVCPNTSVIVINNL